MTRSTNNGDHDNLEPIPAIEIDGEGRRAPRTGAGRHAARPTGTAGAGAHADAGAQAQRAAGTAGAGQPQRPAGAPGTPGAAGQPHAAGARTAPPAGAGRHSAPAVFGLPGRKGGKARGNGGTASAPRAGRKPRKPGFIKTQVNRWCDRLLGAVSDRTLAGQEAEYASGRTRRDYIWNTVGVGAWGMVFPVLTIVVTQLVGVEQAGMFSLAFIAALMLMFVGNYGVRTYQVSDLDEQHSFADYQANRLITCVVMMVAGVLYCNIRGYADQMFLISMGVYAYKMVDALADVYEGRLQQVDKLYLAGISQAFRSVAALAVFSFVLLITRDLAVASIAMAVVSALTFLVLTLPLAMFETPKSRRMNPRNVVGLLVQCFPLFVALFMYNLIDNMPKFVMEGVLSYDNQLYYNALYFPAHAILLTVGFIYKPLLLRMAEVWADPAKRRRFDLIILVIAAVIVVVTLAVAGIMNWFGLSLMSLLYGVDFGQFRGLCFVMLAAGGVTAAIDFLYQVITVLRRQRAVTRLYLITFGFSLFVPILLVNFTGLPGAVIGYLIVMCILLVLLVSEYISIRIDLKAKLTGVPTGRAEMPRASRRLEAGVGRGTRADSARAGAGGTRADGAQAGAAGADAGGGAPRRRPSEVRAERERREAVRKRGSGSK